MSWNKSTLRLISDINEKIFHVSPPDISLFISLASLLVQSNQRETQNSKLSYIFFPTLEQWFPSKLSRNFASYFYSCPYLHYHSNNSSKDNNVTKKVASVVLVG
jgi:hypothetical protein